MERYKIYDDNLHLFAQMLRDIASARRYVYLETYSFGNDSIGEKFRNALTKKAKEGVEIRVLMDGYGSDVSENFFNELKAYGGEVTLFRKIRFAPSMFKRNNSRDHRKLLVIDDKLVYIGSANITQRSLGWRESTLRMEHNIAKKFRHVFLQSLSIADKFYFRKSKHIIPIKFREFEIIRVVPSFRYRNVRKRLLSMIKSAKDEIIIETPYLLPGFRISEALIKAAKRKVDVKIIIPVASDVKVADIVRQKYFGKFHKHGIKVLFYRPEFIHAKTILVDDRIFSIGSSNIDHRSTNLQFEINLMGTNKSVLEEVRKHLDKTLTACEPFDYEGWKNRSIAVRIMERVFSLIEYWL